MHPTPFCLVVAVVVGGVGAELVVEADVDDGGVAVRVDVDTVVVVEPVGGGVVADVLELLDVLGTGAEDVVAVVADVWVVELDDTAGLLATSVVKATST